MVDEDDPNFNFVEIDRYWDGHDVSFGLNDG